MTVPAGPDPADLVTDDAVAAAGNAMREKWLREHPGIAALELDPMDWARTALEAGADMIVAAWQHWEEARMRHDA